MEANNIGISLKTISRRARFADIIKNITIADVADERYAFLPDIIQIPNSISNTENAIKAVDANPEFCINFGKKPIQELGSKRDPSPAYK